MNDTQLRLFLSVADHGSFSRAEDAQFISKQAILRQINSLEAEIGVPLFSRTAAGVTLTPAGKEFYHGAKKLLKLQEQVVSACRCAVPAPEIIRIGQVEHQTLLNRVTDAFVLKYPDIQIQKVIHPNHSGEYRVTNRITDVGETFTPTSWPPRPIPTPSWPICPTWPPCATGTPCLPARASPCPN